MALNRDSVLRILINAYACCPGIGSEPGMAWNFISGLAHLGCDLYVITESEFQARILDAMDSSDFPRENLHWFFLPIGETEDDSCRIRRLCWNQGSWSFYGYYARWQNKALGVAREIVDSHDIDIMHQLNMAGFREPGMLYKINEARVKDGKTHIPLVWGPSAGYGRIPLSFMFCGGLSFLSFYSLKNCLNVIQMRMHWRVRKMCREADVILAATPENEMAYRCIHKRDDVILMNETGTYLDALPDANVEQPIPGRSKSKNVPFRLLWVGRFIYTKQLKLALQVIASLGRFDVELHIVGRGSSEKDTERFRHYADKLGVGELCHWHGYVPNVEVQRMMRESDVFFFSSIFEATSTVVLEAISNGLPVVCFDLCGFGPIVAHEPCLSVKDYSVSSGDVGIKIACTSPRFAVKDFSQVILFLMENPEILSVLRSNCVKKSNDLSWRRKLENLQEIYSQVICP